VIRVTLNGGVRRAFLTFSLGLAISAGCANGGDSSGAASSGDDGGATGDDAPASGDAPPPHDGGKTDGEGGGSGTSAAKACADNAAAYCAQLEKCASFLVTVQYGDQLDAGPELTCVARTTAGCIDQLQAPGTGWTGDALEACIAARNALDCNTFLHGKPAPKACRVTGGIPNSNPCRYDAQCGGAYCRYAAGASCGTCVGLGATGAPCTATSDCDGNLVCALSGGSGTCQPPVGAGGACDATHPCQLGLACLAGTCAAPGGLGATCAAKNGGADCDYDQGVYCDTTSSACKAYVPAQATDACGSLPAVCVGDSTCFGGHCVAPVQDGTACNTQQGQNCMPPQSCNAGTCSLYSATQCK
jgi:hypothetical protein